MDNNRSVVFLIPSMEAGGMERVMSEIVNYIAENYEHKIHLILYGKNSNANFYQISNKVKIHKAPDFQNNIRIEQGFKTLRFIRSKVKVIQPYSILSFGEVWNSWVLLSLVGLKNNILISDRSHPKKSLGFFHNIFRKIIYRRASLLIAQTDYAKGVFDKQFKNLKVLVIANPIQNFYNEHENSRDKIVLSVGRFTQSKNHELLIKLFIEINNKEWKLFIVGGDEKGGEMRKKLDRLIKVHNFEERIFLFNKQTDIEKIYYQCRIFAFPSSSEGFPNVVGEAMSARLAVIAFHDVVGPSGLINHNENGILVPFPDFDQFKSSLSELMASEEMQCRLSSNAQNKVTEYSITKIGKKYYEAIFDF